jgi:hypothetical protein
VGFVACAEGLLSKIDDGWSVAGAVGGVVWVAVAPGAGDPGTGVVAAGAALTVCAGEEGNWGGGVSSRDLRGAAAAAAVVVFAAMTVYLI